MKLIKKSILLLALAGGTFLSGGKAYAHQEWQNQVRLLVLKWRSRLCRHTDRRADCFTFDGNDRQR